MSLTAFVSEGNSGSLFPLNSDPCVLHGTLSSTGRLGSGAPMVRPFIEMPLTLRERDRSHPFQGGEQEVSGNVLGGRQPEKRNGEHTWRSSSEPCPHPLQETGLGLCRFLKPAVTLLRVPSSMAYSLPRALSFAASPLCWSGFASLAVQASGETHLSSGEGLRLL